MDQYLLIPFLGDEHPFTSYFDVHQGYKVLTHCHLRQQLLWVCHKCLTHAACHFSLWSLSKIWAFLSPLMANIPSIWAPFLFIDPILSSGVSGCFWLSAWETQFIAATGSPWLLLGNMETPGSAHHSQAPGYIFATPLELLQYGQQTQGSIAGPVIPVGHLCCDTAAFHPASFVIFVQKWWQNHHINW